MNIERISSALQSYNGQEDSMHAVVDVLQDELGENWTDVVFEQLQQLSPALKDNLTHAYNYYAATIAWNETQNYLMDETLQKTPDLEERLPILKHWLDFFGAPGQSAYQELENKLNALPTEDERTDDEEVQMPEAEVIPEEEIALQESEETQTEEETEEVFEQEEEENEVGEWMNSDQPEGDSEESEEELEEKEEEAEWGDSAESEEELENVADKQEQDESEADETEEEYESEEEEKLEIEDTPAVFEIKKLQKQLNLLNQNQAWLSARCIQLKGIEVYAYPFYGFIVDLLRQTLKSMEKIEKDEEMTALLSSVFEGGKEAFDNKKQAIEHDIELAEQNCESATTALISDETDMDEVRRTLGAIDTSDTVEYVGPAPDGFELLDDEAPLDENVIKQQYEKLEKINALTGKTEQNPHENKVIQENTSQNEEKGVQQRKLSFSLKRTKPTEEGSN